MSGPKQPGERIANFDYLRLFLAFEVAFMHASVFSHWGNRNWIIVNPVPAFVCLSGFLIPESFSNSTGWAHFAWKRVLRVVPAFVVSLVLVLMLFGLEAIPPTLLNYVTVGLILVGSNGALWSLMLEEWLYVSHALARLRGWWRAELAATALGLCLLAAIIFSYDNLIDRIFRASSAYFAGNLLYFNREKLDAFNGWFAIAGVVLLGIAGQLWINGTFLFAPLICGIACLAVIAAKRLPQLPRIPDLSYGVYVFHVPIVVGILRFAELPPYEDVLVSLGLTFMLAAASWYMLESKALKLKNVWAKRHVSPSNIPCPEIA